MADDVENTGSESVCWTAGLHARGLNGEARQRLFDLVVDHQDMIEAQLQADFPEGWIGGDLIAVGEPCDRTHGGEQASEVEELKLQVAALKQERDDAVRTVGGYVAKNAELKQERDDALQAIEQVEDRLERTARERDDAVADVGELKGQVAALEQHIDTLSQQDGSSAMSSAHALVRVAEMKRERDVAVQRAVDAELAVRADLSRYPRPWSYALKLVAESLVEQVGWDDVLSPVLEPAKEELREQYPDAQIVYRVCAPDTLPGDMMVSSRYLRSVYVLVIYAFPPMLNEVDERPLDQDPERDYAVELSHHLGDLADRYRRKAQDEE